MNATLYTVDFLTRGDDSRVTSTYLYTKEGSHLFDSDLDALRSEFEEMGSLIVAVTNAVTHKVVWQMKGTQNQ